MAHRKAYLELAIGALIVLLSLPSLHSLVAPATLRMIGHDVGILFLPTLGILILVAGVRDLQSRL